MGPDDITLAHESGHTAAALCLGVPVTPDWPLDPEDGPDCERADRRKLGELAKAFGLTERDWDRILLATLNLTLSPKYRRLVVQITGLLDYVPVLDRTVLSSLA